MVAAIRRGETIRSVARRFGVSASHVKRWLDRAADQRLDRVDFSDHSSAPRRVHNRTSRKVVKLILNTRKQLREHSDLGEFGAAAILAELKRRGIPNPPALRTIGYILQRHGALDYRRRLRRRPPALGWHLPDVVAALAEVDEFDFVEGLVIRGQGEVVVLNAVSLHGGLVESWPQSNWNAEAALAAILEHWRKVGLPDYAQFDNDTRFTGPHQHADVIGSIIRFCLSLGVVAVFAPVGEHGFQNAIECYNGKWQEKVWARTEHRSLSALQRQSARYVLAHRQRRRARIEQAPVRRKFPPKWQYRPDERVSRGRIIFIRRTDDQGRAEILGHKYVVDEHWASRLVRCEVNIAGKEIGFYRLRRSEPDKQPLLRKVAYRLPARYVK
jgi:transposase-like protein